MLGTPADDIDDNDFPFDGYDRAFDYNDENDDSDEDYIALGQLCLELMIIMMAMMITMMTTGMMMNQRPGVTKCNRPQAALLALELPPQLPPQPDQHQ